MDVPPDDPYIDFLTLAEVRDAGYRFRAECPDCKTWAYVDLHRLIRERGKETHWRAIRAVCTHCGHLQKTLLIEWPEHRRPLPPGHLLGWHADRGHDLYTFCPNCEESHGGPRQAYYKARDMAARFGRSKGLCDVVMRCSRCGARCYLRSTEPIPGLSR